MCGMVNATKSLANLLKKGPKYSIERFLPINMERNKDERIKGMAINKPIKIRNNFFIILYMLPPEVNAKLLDRGAVAQSIDKKFQTVIIEDLEKTAAFPGSTPAPCWPMSCISLLVLDLQHPRKFFRGELLYPIESSGKEAL